ncbi:MAG: thiolase family protein [Planctomycetes bacterium]|nr:thiolase family protein [Planctomycetota bacterium]
MGERVAIIGAGQTPHRSRRLDVSAPELIDEAVQAALADAGLEPDGIDAIVVGNMEHFEGIHLSDLWAVEGTGGVGKPHLKIATGGTTGSSLAQAAYYLVAGGMFPTVLAVGWERLSDSEGETTTGIVTAFDPIYERPTLAGAVSGLAVMACQYQARTGVRAEEAALVVVQARENAARNPHAHLSKAVTVPEVLASPLLSSPLRYLDMCPTSDGACAVVFTSRPGARRAAWVRGVASRHNHTLLGDVAEGAHDYINTLEQAAADAYGQAGIRDPRREFDVVEMYEPCTWAALEWAESLGLAPRGHAAALWADGTARRDGDLPINPSGGVLCANPIGATGLVRVAEASAQVRAAAGPLQVDGVRTALVTGFGGSFWSEVMILGSEA